MVSAAGGLLQIMSLIFLHYVNVMMYFPTPDQDDAFYDLSQLIYGLRFTHIQRDSSVPPPPQYIIRVFFHRSPRELLMGQMIVKWRRQSVQQLGSHPCPSVKTSATV